jgi:hypothetical protein
VSELQTYLQQEVAANIIFLFWFKVESAVGIAVVVGIEFDF